MRMGVGGDGEVISEAIMSGDIYSMHDKFDELEIDNM